MKMKFKVMGQPVPKSRPRFTKNGHAYTPKSTADYEKDVCTAYQTTANGYTFTDKPLSIHIIAHLKRAKSNKKEFATSRPDIDNIVKSILDGLNGTAFKDDSQIVNINARKLYCNNVNDIPFVEVELNDGME